MTAVTLPALPRQSQIDAKLIRYGGDLASALGGPTQRIRRLGSRFSIQVQLPTLDLACARTWIAARMKAEAEGVTLRLALPQLGDTSAAPTGGSGAGTTLPVSSAAGIAVGMLFSFEKSSHLYLHQVTAISGNDLSIAPILRADPNAVALNFAAPAAEGLIDDIAWSLTSMRFVGQSFTLTEDR